MRQSLLSLNCRMASLGWRTAVSYAALAPVYDALLGDRLFPQLRRVFDWLVQCYGIHFSSAADVACGTGTFVRYLRERGVPVVYGVDALTGDAVRRYRQEPGYQCAFLAPGLCDATTSPAEGSGSDIEMQSES
jgi:hypothetical protein